MIKRTASFPTLFSSLDDLLNQQYPLYKLSNKIGWQFFENSFTPLYCADNGRPAKPIRLMCGLLILKHLRNLSDESVVHNFNSILSFHALRALGIVGENRDIYIQVYFFPLEYLSLR